MTELRRLSASGRRVSSMAEAASAGVQEEAAGSRKLAVQGQFLERDLDGRRWSPLSPAP
jgi:hypothetical protein